MIIYYIISFIILHGWSTVYFIFENLIQVFLDHLILKNVLHSLPGEDLDDNQFYPSSSCFR